MQNNLYQEFSKQLITNLYKQTELMKTIELCDEDFNFETNFIEKLNTSFEIIGSWKKNIFNLNNSKTAEILKGQFDLQDNFECEEIVIDHLGIIGLSVSSNNIYYIVEKLGLIILVVFKIEDQVNLPYTRIPIFITKCINQFEFLHKPSIIKLLDEYLIAYTEKDNEICVSYEFEIPKFLFKKASIGYKKIVFEFDNNMIKNLYVERQKK